MPVKRCIIKGAEVDSLDRLYDALVAGLKLPKHFGRNLDALHDVLTTDVAGPVEIVWKDSAFSGKMMGTDFTRAVKLLKKAAAARSDFTVIID